MNYQKIYDSIINKAKSLEESRKLQKKQKTNYFERHHITPKCLGGSNDKENLVLLTAKEHYICHRLLCKLYPDNDHILYALFCMSNGLGYGEAIVNRYVPSARIYEQVKHEYSTLMSKRFKGVPKSLEQKRKISDAHKGKIVSEETKKLLSKINKGKKLSTETIEKMSKTLKGKPKSEQCRQNMKKPKPIVTCPHCGISGGLNVMMQWHFKNCKLIPGNEHVHDFRINTIHKCPKCDKQSTSLSNLKRYHFDNCGKKVDQIKCPHCNKECDKRNAKKYHFDKCKFKLVI